MLDAREKLVLSKIDEKRLIGIHHDLIGISSQNPPGEEREIAEYCAWKCRELGLDVQIIAKEEPRANLIATLTGNQVKPCLVYHAHLDTVPIGDRSKWHFNPRGGEITEGKIYGRGACDTKNSIAAMLCATEAIIKAGIDIKGKLVLCFTADEEKEARYGIEYLLNQGYLSNADMVVAGEQTDLCVAIAEKGAARFNIHTHGISAHASMVAEAGVNAISKMAKIALAIEKEFSDPVQKHRLLGGITCNAGMIEGGTKINVVPEHCLLQLDCRFPPGQKATDIHNILETIITRLHKEDPQLDAALEFLHELPPFEIDENAPLVSRLRKAIQKIKEVDLGVTGYYPVSDGRFFAERGIPTVVFGSGSSLQAHTTDEFVEKDQLIDSAKILTLLALDVLTTG